jgi:hypothetical protein
MFSLLAPLVLVSTSAHAGAVASHFQPENKKGTNYWNAGAAIDGKFETAWSLPGDTVNRGESITIDVPKGDVEKIGIVAGWDKDEDSFKDYPRVKQLRVDVYTIDNDQAEKQVASETLDIADKRGWQVLALKTKATVGTDSFFGGKVKLSIVDIYDGEDYPNLRVSEVAVYLAEMAATPTLKIDSGTTTGDETALTDNNAKTLWVGTPGATFTVSPMGWAISSIGFQGDKTKGRAKTVKVKVGDAGPEQTFTLNDKPDLQWISLAPFNGVVGSTIDDVQITVVDSYGADVGLQELKFKATSFEPL